MTYGNVAVTQFNDLMPYEYVGGTSVATSAMNTYGSLLKITSSSASTQGSYIGIDFSGLNVPVLAIESMVIHLYKVDGGQIRFPLAVKTDSTALEYHGALSHEIGTGWKEVTISDVATLSRQFRNASNELGMIYFGVRSASTLYLGGITIHYDDTALNAFTKDGEFSVDWAAGTKSPAIVGAATEGLPSSDGYALKIAPSDSQYVTIDFSASKIPANDVANLLVRAYLPNAYTNADNTATYTDANYEFRINSANVEANIGKYNMSDWFEVEISKDQIATDADGYLTTIKVGLRNKGNTASYFYIDTIELMMLEEKVVQVGALQMYATSNYLTRVDRLYLKPIDQSVEWLSSNGNFFYESGTSFQIIRNGEVVFSKLIALASRYSSDVKHFYLKLDDHPEIVLQAGDIVRYGGTYTNTDNKMVYVIEDSEFLWNGYKWNDYGDLQVMELGKLAVHSNSSGATSNVPKATQLYLKIANGTAIPFPDKDWNTEFVYEKGTGILLNGENITSTLGDMESTNSGLFYNLANANVQEGDVLTIGGTFICAEAGVMAKYVFEDSKFLWNGTKWENYVEYTTYQLGTLKFSSTAANGKQIYLLKSDGTATHVPADGNNGWTAAFACKSGVGIAINGVTVTAEVKLPNSFFINLPSAPEKGDVLTIAGTFYNSELALEYVVEESKFEWNGTKWMAYVEYTTYSISAISGSPDCNAKSLQVGMTSDQEIPAGDWTNYYTFEAGSGTGITLNDVALSTTDIKHPGYFYVGLGTTAVRGDKVTIDGVFYNETLARKFDFDNCVLYFDGTNWVATAPVEYTTYTITAIGANGDSSATAVYLYSVAGDKLPKEKGNWDDVYTFEAGSGNGLMINGVAAPGGAIKMPGDLYVPLGMTAVVGDAVTLDGTYYNEKNAVKLVFVNCVLYFDGANWVETKPTNYATYEVGKLAIGSDTTTKGLYLTPLNGGSYALYDSKWNERLSFVAGSGAGITFNGATASIGDVKIPTAKSIYVGLKATPVAGDKVVIEGTFYNEALAVQYVVEKTVFVFNGTAWEYADEMFEEYDRVTMYDIGLGYGVIANGNFDRSNHSYTASEGNTTGSTKFVFGYNASSVAGTWDIRLSGENWAGFHFRLSNGKISFHNGADKTAGITLVAGVDYIIELGTLKMKDGNVWTYAKVDGKVVMYQLLTNPNPAYTTSKVSVYGGGVVDVALTHPDYAVVEYKTTLGTSVQTVEKGQETSLKSGGTYNAVIGWVDGEGTIYQATEGVEITGRSVYTALEIEFVMESGAAIRLFETADASGIRFTTYINKAQLDALIGQYGITGISYGTLIMPYDYLGADQEPNLAEFVIDDTILKIPTEKFEAVNGRTEKGEEVNASTEYVKYFGAMNKLYTENYARLFAGRAYMEITFENGEVWTIYTAFNYEDNVRSVRYIARALKADTAEYDALSAAKQAVVDTYIGGVAIDLMDYDAYVNNVLNVIAWNYPNLDETNAYMNETNYQIATDMKNAGIQIVNLTGANILTIENEKNIQKTREMIRFFNSQGLKTVVFANNGASNNNVNLVAKGYPDFSDCDGFIGFLAWDEPYNTEDAMATLADFANAFEIVYAGTEVTFMVNLLPSYADIFYDTEGKNKVLNPEAFKEYLQMYCDTVLSQIDDGEKWLSLDTYPILKDYSLLQNFLFDLAMLKKTAVENDAHAHVALQSSGWSVGTNDSKSRIPTEAEMRMQAYAAMAFGMNSISWYTYTPSNVNTGNTFVDNNGNIVNETAYNAFAKVNKEIAEVGKVYSAFDWKGIIVGAGKDNGTTVMGVTISTDDDYQACALAANHLGAYKLSAASTKLVASVSTNKTDWNYLMSVMEDKNGNEGYVLCNYNSCKNNMQQTITISFKENVTKAMIYQGADEGWKTVDVANQQLTITLATGAGAFVLPSQLN